MTHKPLDKTTLRAFKRALDRRNPRRLTNTTYIGGLYPGIREPGRMCAVGALAVSEATRGFTQRLEPEQIARHFGPGTFSYYAAIAHLNKRTINAVERVNNRGYVSDEARYAAVYAFVTRALRRAK